MKVLNLYAGIGGNRKLWQDVEVTAVELDPKIAAIYQDFFPDDKVIVADAHQYLLDHYKEFDFIWASPPCQTHSRINKNFGYIRYADMNLYQEIILLKTWFKGKYCIENVWPYYDPLIPAQQFNRNFFWCNFKIITTDKGNPEKEITMIAQKTKRRGANGFNMRYADDRQAKQTQEQRNQLNPNTGLMILNCARGIITKQNEKQIDLFE